MQTQTIQKTEQALQTCVNCGHTGDNLIGNYYWVGGQGYVLFFECQDCLDVCWEESQKACKALKVAIEADTKEIFDSAR